MQKEQLVSVVIQKLFSPKTEAENLSLHTSGSAEGSFPTVPASLQSTRLQRILINVRFSRQQLQVGTDVEMEDAKNKPESLNQLKVTEMRHSAFEFGLILEYKNVRDRWSWSYCLHSSTARLST